MPALACVCAALLWVGRSSEARTSLGGENVLIVLVDALRADRLGVHARGHATSPFIDGLAERAVVFDHATSTAPQTVPSVLSLLSSTYPSRHGNQYYFDTASFRTTEREELPLVPRELPLMAEHFRDRGYRTGAVVTNPWLQPKWGFARGFERYEFINRGRGPIVNRTGLEMIDGWGRERPFLLYLHYMDVHFPRLPRSEFKQASSAGLPGKSVYANDVYPDLSEEDRLHSLAVYDACVRSMDELLRELMAGLEQRGLDESTLLVVVADHGDEFGEHGGLGHGRTLYQEMLAVPLQFVHPALGDHARRISEPVSLVDVLPTLLELTGGRVPPGLMGNSLAHLILPGAAHPSAASSALISELGLTKSIREGDRKLIWFPDAGRFEAYELGLDPTERHALDVERPWVEDLGAKLQDFLAQTRPLEGSALPAEEGPGHDELMRSLEALGYVR